MLDHLFDNWGYYLCVALLGGLIWGVFAINSDETARVTSCYAQNMVVVETDAGFRCASLDALYPVRVK